MSLSDAEYGVELRLPVHGRAGGRVSGGTIYGRRLGDPANPLKLLFFPGVGLTWATWRQVMPALAPLADCVAIDMLGFGRSDADRRSDVTVTGQTAMVPSLLDALRWRRAVLVGHSMGGGVALGTAFTYGARVQALVLVGSIAYPQPVPPFFWPLYAPLMDELQALGIRLFSASHLARVLARYGYDEVAARDFLEQLTRRSVGRSFVTAIRNLRPSEYVRFSRLFSAIWQPVLIVHGDRDHIVPPDVARRLNETLPDNELHWVHGASHLPQESHPRAVVAAIEDFIQRRLAGGGREAAP